MINEIALFAFRATWIPRAFALFSDVVREEQADVAVRGRSGFAYQRWLAALTTVWLGIADGWGHVTVEALAGVGLQKAFHQEEAVLAEITEIVTQKSLLITHASESAWLPLGPPDQEIWSASRTISMAQTETVQATGWTQHSVATRAPAQMFKIWQSIIDDRTRISHLDANGQRRLLNDPFDVGSAALQWPADAGGPLAEIINCRCWEDYELAQAPGSVPALPGFDL